MSHRISLYSAIPMVMTFVIKRREVSCYENLNYLLGILKKNGLFKSKSILCKLKKERTPDKG